MTDDFFHDFTDDEFRDFIQDLHPDEFEAIWHYAKPWMRKIMNEGAAKRGSFNNTKYMYTINEKEKTITIHSPTNMKVLLERLYGEDPDEWVIQPDIKYVETVREAIPDNVKWMSHRFIDPLPMPITC